jgi:hypothetical protein
MAISLKFFMIKRGLSFDKLVEKSGAKSAEDLVRYMRGLSVGVTANDEADVRNYFASIKTAPPDPTASAVEQVEAAPDDLDTVAQDDKPKRRRSKKSGGSDV